MLATGNFGTADTTTDRHLDTFGTGAHSSGDGVLDGTAILNTAFNLFGDILGNQHGVHFGVLHLADVHLNILAGEFLQLFAEFVNFRTGTSDNQTRTGGIDCDGEHLERALDVNLRDAGFCQTGIEVLTDLVVLNQLLLELSATEPVGIPSADDA